MSLLDREPRIASWPWRVWLAFEIRPGIRASRDLESHWVPLARSCRGPDGRMDTVELERWFDLVVEYDHLWGDA